MRLITSFLTSMLISTLPAQKVVPAPAEQFTMRPYTEQAILTPGDTKCSSSLTPWWRYPDPSWLSTPWLCSRVSEGFSDSAKICFGAYFWWLVCLLSCGKYAPVHNKKNTAKVVFSFYDLSGIINLIQSNTIMTILGLIQFFTAGTDRRTL